MDINFSKRLAALLLMIFSFTMGQSQVLLSEDFNSGLPATWSITNGGSSTATWFRTSGGYNGQYLNGSEFMFVNSDAEGGIPPVLLHEELVSPIVNTTGIATLNLEFDHYFNFFGLTDSAHVEVFDGSNWNRIVSYTSAVGAFNNPAHAQLNVSAYSNPNFQFRFVYDDDTTWAWFWAIDNVELIAPSNLDAGIDTWITPASNGRVLTSLEFSSSEVIAVDVKNFGIDTLNNIPVYFQADSGPIQGPEFLMGPLPPGQSQQHTFSATANLSALGQHTLRAWTAFPSDAQVGNDTLVYTISQLANPSLAFPHCIDFESLRDTTIQHPVVGLPGLDEMDFTTSVIGAGRLRTSAGSGFSHSGIKAITFDRSPSGAPNAINLATFTWNLAGYDVNSDVFELDLWIMEHGDEFQPSDSVWVRGCDTCSLINVLSWNQLTSGANGIYFNNTPINTSAMLSSRGQNYSSSFQLVIGQADNFAATSLTGADGMTFDDICLSRILPINAGVTAILSPAANGSCGDTSTTVTFTVANLGTDTLHNIPVEVLISGGTNASFQDTIAGPLAPGSQINHTVGPFNSTSGSQFQITAWTQLPGDLSILDDSITTTVIIAPVLSAPLTGADTLCVGGNGWVYVSQPDSNVSYAWFDNLSGGTFLGEGDSLAVGPLNAPNSYYAEPRTITRDHLGPPTNQFGTGADFSNFADGLVFDAFIDIVLDSVTIYPADTGMVSVVLRSSGGQTMDSIAVLVLPIFPNAPVRIPVGIAIPAGIDYELSATGSTISGLYRNNSGANYPYTLPSVAQIKDPINALSGYYYFWYDWGIRYTNCPGLRGIATTDTTTALPQALFSRTATGLNASFSNNAANANIFHWDFGDGTSSNLANPQHSYATNGTYSVCLTANNPCGSDTFCDTITVNCLPLMTSFAYTSSGLLLQINDTTAGVSGRIWDFGDGQTGLLPSEFHNYASDGIYHVCLSNWNVCNDTVTVCDSIAVCQSINAAISFNQNGGGGLDYDFQDATSGTPVSWHWDFGDGDSSSLAQPTHTYGNSGSYTVTLIVTNICGVSDTSQVMLGVVGIDAHQNFPFDFWPNPARSQIHLELQLSNAEHVKVQLLNLQGQVLRMTTFAGITGKNEFEFRLCQQAAGAYFIELKTADIQVRRLIIIQQE